MLRMDEWIKKADTLQEALPYIQKFRGALIVVKFGGSSMEDPELVKSTMRDIVLMECIGFKPIVVHGGGKAISAELKRQNIPVKFVNGLRHTCERTISVVDDVLHNQVNANLVQLAKGFGGPAVAISGKNILTAEKILSKDPHTGEEQDVGFVGGIVNVDVAPIQAALAAGQIPIITPLGTGRDGQVYNINADIAACQIAEAVHARKLVFLSDVPGVYYRTVASATTDATFPILKNNQVTVKTTVTKEMMAAVKANAELVKLSFTAYAVQKENVADVTTAWSIANGNN